MVLILEKVVGENFKGKAHIEVNFNHPTTNITGENGSGKTTIKEMVSWVFGDVNADLVSNPNIRPDGADDGIITRVDVLFKADGKPISFAKIQKVKSKTGNDGKTKTTKTNSYEVNSVPKSQRDAFKYLEELGFDTERYLILTDPNVFLKGMSEKKARSAIRSTLFGMTTEVSDKDVAKKAGLKELAKMLANYDKEEIVAMQNATKRKITAEYGKNGEVIDYKIDGLNSGKVDIDVATLEGQKAAVASEIAEIEQRIADTENGKSAIDEILNSITELEKQKQNHLDRLRNEAVKENRARIEKQYEVQDNIRAIEREIENVKSIIVDAGFDIERMDTAVKDEQKHYKEVKASKFAALKFDKKSLVCPTCGRPFDEEQSNEIRIKFEQKVSAAKKAFEERKASDLEAIVKQGKHYSARRDKAKADKKTFEDKLKDAEKRLKAEQKAFKAIPDSVTVVTEDDFTKAIDGQIAELHEKVKDFDSSKVRAELAENLKEANERFRNIDREIAKSENNANIDRQIAELQAKRLEYEQARLDADRILDEVKELEMAKNELLTEQINSHFKLVKWVLFETQANGEILTDRCTPYIDGLSIVDSVNTGRVILAKLDICNSLQNFYGQHYPIWLDNFEAVTSNTANRFSVDTQLITLSAVEGQELTVR